MSFVFNFPHFMMNMTKELAAEGALLCWDCIWACLSGEIQRDREHDCLQILNALRISQ